MFTRPLHELRRFWQKIWVRIALIAALSVLSVFAAELFEPLISESYKSRFSPQAVLPILTILGNSMLAVTTFSLSVMVSAHRAAAQHTTPRVHRLLLQDRRTQTVLATFLGAFIYALSSIIMLKAGYLQAGATVIIFATTLGVVVLVVVQILRWIDHLSTLGSMDHTLATAESYARESLDTYCRAPCLGAAPWPAEAAPPQRAQTILAPTSGYLQLIDIAAIARHQADCGRIFIDVTPGDFILQGAPMAYAEAAAEDLCDALANCFVLGDLRSHEQDPRYALEVLSETSSRALSPGVNDPGTAIDVIHRLTRLLLPWAQDPSGDADPDHPEVLIRPLPPAALLQAAFAALARDGAGQVEVMITLRRALNQLQTASSGPLAEALGQCRALADAYAEAGLTLKLEQAQYRAT